MWANQLLRTGSLSISENGVTDDWRIFYPNTVPKPLELLTGFTRIPGSTLYRCILIVLTAALVLAAAFHAAGKGADGTLAALYLGLNPVFIFLAVRGNPAIPFIGAVFLLQTAKGSSAGAILASLARPEGFFYGGWHCLKERNWRLLIFLGAAAGIWLAFHRMTCGSFIWASEEVKYSVAAMSYPTPNPLTFLPWAGIRSILILGAPAAAILYSGFKRWELRVPFTVNFALLTVSLALGSLVLPRYVDQLYLLAAPFIFMETGRLFRGRAKMMIAAAVLLFPAFQWISVVPEMAEYSRIRSFYSGVELSGSGVTAANELLIPGIALENRIYDPRGLFISSDRAAWEGATEADLASFGVETFIVLPEGIYFPQHTRSWIESQTDLEVIYYEK